MTINLEEIESRANAATPGPWTWWTSNSWRRLRGRHDEMVLCPRIDRGDSHPNCTISDEDMSFIARAREDVPALVSEVRRLRAEIGAETCDPNAEPELTPDGRWTLRQVVEQAAVLYECLRRDAVVDDDPQGENFWEGHRDTALHTLGRLQEAHGVADAALAGLTKSTAGAAGKETLTKEVTHGAPAERPELGERQEAGRAEPSTFTSAGRAEGSRPPTAPPRASGTIDLSRVGRVDTRSRTTGSPCAPAPGGRRCATHHGLPRADDERCEEGR